jgi:hypothetical protein
MTDAQLCALLGRLRDSDRPEPPNQGDWPSRPDLLAVEEKGLIALDDGTRTLCRALDDTPLVSSQVNISITEAGARYLDERC